MNNQHVKFNDISYIMKLGRARPVLLYYIHEAFPTRHFKHGKPKRMRKAV